MLQGLIEVNRKVSEEHNASIFRAVKTSNLIQKEIRQFPYQENTMNNTRNRGSTNYKLCRSKRLGEHEAFPFCSKCSNSEYFHSL
jgi:hypothetical protein